VPPEQSPRIGLALSGGGFRAAFFHVGVLARMADLDLLRHVRMLSCVSGGSVAGAVYYVSLIRKLMEDNNTARPGEPLALREAPLTAAEYAGCVSATRAVLAQMGRANVRAAMFRNPWKNLVMFLSPSYSRTDRAGDMLDERIREGFGLDSGYRHAHIANQLQLRSLHVDRPDVPRLVLNATTLNTGHTWRFETWGMGELMPGRRRLVDRNDLLVFRPFLQLPDRQRDFPLGLAIAASAAFPGLFRPLPISGLYGRTVDLMDGGAQDNQGIQTLMEHCFAAPDRAFDGIVVSDGSGQLEDELTKRRSALALGRIIGVQGDRIREEQLLAAAGKLEAAGAAFYLLDLRHGLPYADVPAAGASPQPAGGASSLVRERLARLRTDLDAFGALESSLLEARGYEVAGAVFGQPPDSSGLPEAVAGSRRDEVLAAAAAQLLKPLRVYSADGFVAFLLLAALVATAVWALRFVRDEPDWRLTVVPLALATFFILPAVASRAVFRLTANRTLPRSVRWGAGAVLYAILLVVAVAGGPEVASWGEHDWSRPKSLAVAAGLLAAPALLPCVLALVLQLEGLWWRRLARSGSG
jgi:predicted acylesterase/phospholipase RssA